MGAYCINISSRFIFFTNLVVENISSTIWLIFYIKFLKILGIDLNTLIMYAHNIKTIKKSERDQEICKLASLITDFLNLNETRQLKQKILCFRFGYSLGSKLSTLYLGIKFLYLCIIGQFFLLNRFIGHGYSLWGLTVLQSLWTGEDWKDLIIFPRVSLCNF